MSTNLGIHRVEAWQSFTAHSDDLPHLSRGRRVPICRGLLIMLIIPTIMLMIYLALPVAMSSISPSVVRSEAPSTLHIDPACSPFGALTTCVQVAIPSNSPPA